MCEHKEHLASEVTFRIDLCNPQAKLLSANADSNVNVGGSVTAADIKVLG